jgi:hypothetical protein
MTPVKVLDRKLPQALEGQGFAVGAITITWGLLPGTGGSFAAKMAGHLSSGGF